MTEKQKEQYEEELKKVMEDVRFKGMKAGATGILGAILDMCNQGASVGKIKCFCKNALNMEGMKE